MYIINPPEAVTNVIEPLATAPVRLPSTSRLDPPPSSPSLSEFEELLPASFSPDFSSELLPCLPSHNTSHGSINSELPSESLSNSRSHSPAISEFEQLIPTDFIPDLPVCLLPYSLSYNNPTPPQHTSSSVRLPSENSSGSWSSSPMSAEFEDLIPSISSCAADSSADSRLFNPNYPDRNYHGSSDHFDRGSDTSRSGIDSANVIPSVHLPRGPAPRGASTAPPTSPVTRHKSPAIDIVPYSCGAFPQRPKTVQSSLNLSGWTASRAIILPPRSRSPRSLSSTDSTQSTTVLIDEFSSSPTGIPLISPEPVPDSAVSIHQPMPPSSPPSSPPFLSRFERLPPPLLVPDFSFDRLPYDLIYESVGSDQGSSENLADLRFRSVRVQCPIRPPSAVQPSSNNGSDSRCTSPQPSTDPPHNPETQEESVLASPITPPSSPHLIADRDPFYLVDPPQMLPWEGQPPPGLTERNHAAYQRAGVHWMLAQIFGTHRIKGLWGEKEQGGMDGKASSFRTL